MILICELMDLDPEGEAGLALRLEAMRKLKISPQTLKDLNGIATVSFS